MTINILHINKQSLSFILGAFVGFVLCSAILSSRYNKDSTQLQELRSPVVDSCSVNRKGKRILLWTTFWMRASEHWERLFHRQLSAQCPISDCELVYDARLIETADAVLVHPIDKGNNALPPVQSRPGGQKWIFFTIESPAIVKGYWNAQTSSDVYDLTMSYREDSDIVVPYGVTYQRTSPEYRYEDIWASKNESFFAIAVISNCQTISKRETFILDLLDYIDVHVYGNCGSRKCGKWHTGSTNDDVMKDPCIPTIIKYKFYFAFENSICLDYVTEKFFKSLNLNVIPVVMGGANYSKLAPPDSFINALDFNGPENLAQYLLRVGNNQTLYNSYFLWRNNYYVEMGDPVATRICDLCATLHNSSSLFLHSHKSKSPSLQNLSIKEWFVDKSDCKSWTEALRKQKP